ncbi:Methylpurine-DNA glycosylase (MPG) [Balamuthia mandrillaris]
MENPETWLRDTILAFPELEELAKEDKGDSEEVRAAYAELFTAIASRLLNETAMYINDKPHRFVEVEFYLKGPFNHIDIFTHCDERQQTCGKWYFHRTGSGYKGGSYKGMDLTFGGQKPASSKPAVYGGILIRAIQPLDPVTNKPTGDLIEGPCLVVDHVLELCDSPSIQDFVGTHCETADVPSAATRPGSKLYVAPLDTSSSSSSSSSSNGKAKKKNTDKGKEKKEAEEEEHAPAQLWASPRVGLSGKKQLDGMEYYIMKNYRFHSAPNLMKKGKPNQILALHVSGKYSVEQICAAMGMKAAGKKTVQGYIADYEKGKKGSKKAKEFFAMKSLSTGAWNELYGVIARDYF